MIWQAEGKCVGEDPARWDVKNLDPILRDEQARAACDGCPVIEQCREFAAKPFRSGMEVHFEDYTLETRGVVMGGVVW